MTNYTVGKRVAFAFAILATAFVLSTPLRGAEEQKRPAPRTEKPEPRDSESKMSDTKDCKKIYRIVHRGPPGKGFDKLVLDRVECPIERA